MVFIANRIYYLFFFSLILSGNVESTSQAEVQEDVEKKLSHFQETHISFLLLSRHPIPANLALKPQDA
ncbi:uncharacterized protein G2W53_000104 [Senna tora]|uniref:Uncharacterized protein n=1 Tax=Senna tora TaxID=362788 RepID=A0A834XF31_9FABA|nr:uncharacterized protein G2W53_000104 [Senna tora]